MHFYSRARSLNNCEGVQTKAEWNGQDKLWKLKNEEEWMNRGKHKDLSQNGTGTGPTIW